MAEQPFWDGSGGSGDLAWEQCWLAGSLLPGFSSVECKRVRRIEKKSAKGQDGTTVTDQGDELMEITIRTKVVSAVDWAQWQDLFKVLWAKKAGASRGPVTIEHPKPNALGVQEVYLEEIDPQGPDDQIMVVVTKCFEYVENPRPVQQAAGRNPPPVQRDPDVYVPPALGSQDVYAEGFDDSRLDDIVAGRGGLWD